MKLTINKIAKTLLASLLFATLFSACKDEMPYGEFPGLFRPINFTADLNKTEVTLHWSKVTGAESYTLQVSTDSLNFSDLVVDTTITTLFYKQDFEGKKTFFARIKANSVDTLKNSKFNQIMFKTPSENIFLPNQVLVNAQKTVQLGWEPGRTVTHIEMQAENGGIELFPVSVEESAIGIKTCNVAENNKVYSIRIYNGTILRGTISLKVEGDIFLNPGESLKTAIEAATGSYFVVILKPGDYSLSSSTVCPTGTSLIIKGVDKVNRTKVAVQNNTTVLTLPASADSIVIRDIDFSAVTANNTAYFVNQSAQATALNLFKFDGCKLTGFGNNILRLQGSSVKRINNFVVNNCIVTSCGGSGSAPLNGSYAFVNSNIDNGFVQHILITNSTFNGVSHTFLNVPGTSGSTSTAIVSSIKIENCTFYNFIGGTTSTRYFIDGGAATNNALIDITLSKLIFGKTMATNVPGGIRVSAGALNVSSVYSTTDFNSAISIPGVTVYPKASADLWTDPANGVFTLKDTNFAGKGVAGDLRWY